MDPDIGALPAEFVGHFNEANHILGNVANRVTRWGTREPRVTNELLELRRRVTNVFDNASAMTWPPEDANEPPGAEHYKEIPFQLDHWIRDRGNGRATFAPDPALASFKEAFEDVELRRIRRCPVEDCGRYFYAVRANTGACSLHLARARMQRVRDPEKRQQYEETRQVNRLVATKKLSIAKARAVVKGKQQSRKETQ
jgi:hypothetical protein